MDTPGNHQEQLHSDSLNVSPRPVYLEVTSQKRDIVAEGTIL